MISTILPSAKDKLLGRMESLTLVWQVVLKTESSEFNLMDAI